MSEPSLTPMMQQYRELKARDPEALLLFRMGDFYEMFGEDAERASALLGLTLTTRDKGPGAVPMAGFPHPALEAYLAKLVQAGQRAAVCEQVEDARFAKGLVRREVVRVVTTSPGWPRRVRTQGASTLSSEIRSSEGSSRAISSVSSRLRRVISSSASVSPRR